jgi:large-conductance mechanosensitive channel
MRNLLTEFRQFTLRGNVVDLAVGIVIGVAFTGWSRTWCGTLSTR